MISKLSFLLSLCLIVQVQGQDYFLDDYGPYAPDIPTPAAFLGYEIGDHHTRHDRIVSYFEKLASMSNQASFEIYGRSYGHRDLIMLTVTASDNHVRLEQIQSAHLERNDPTKSEFSTDDPIIIQLGYGVHGNESSSAEAAMIVAYILTASQHPVIQDYRDKAVIFIDPVINPDGRDRHSHWANMHKASILVKDPIDIEHNEGWPRGRTNHYWFDLNRDWWLAIHPESRSKLKWYHKWYPNVVTDFHEMGTNSTHFFEPMKVNGSEDPIMPIENYTTLNDTFARYFAEGLDKIGSLYFTKEVFDGTYPGYGSSYPDLQGGLGLLFEQASSRGHVQKTPTGDLTFAFTIRNQLVSSMATVKAGVEQKELLLTYQNYFFRSALDNATRDPVKAYVFGDQWDRSRLNAFIDKLLLHQVKLYELDRELTIEGQKFHPGSSYVVPTNQVQYRMVQSVFETYDTYHDSVFYDASAWSLANFYNVTYKGSKQDIGLGQQVQRENISKAVDPVSVSNYAYLIPWTDYNAPALLYQLLAADIVVYSAFKPFSTKVNGDAEHFGYGTLMIPVKQEQIAPDSLHSVLAGLSKKYALEVKAVATGLNLSGVDLGSRYFEPLTKPKAVMLVGNGVASYEAGEVWHLLDQRIHMPITKVDIRMATQLKLEEYNVVVLVSGNYGALDSTMKKQISDWVSKGNTLVTIRQASSWVLQQNLVKDTLIGKVQEKEASATGEKEEAIPAKRLAYVDAREHYGKTRIGGTIFEVQLDLTHPLAFGYMKARVPVYRNSNVWIKPSDNPYSNVAMYTDDPHIDGFISKENLEEKLKKSASLV
ncbi:MAG: M14 family zinc carboxypeptidase, partial [Saprospiraceae bacterium]|nr:M14 family zinc carboxypeptidase [Saprospiraceae bacterium]